MFGAFSANISLTISRNNEVLRMKLYSIHNDIGILRALNCHKAHFLLIPKPRANDLLPENWANDNWKNLLN